MAEEAIALPDKARLVKMFERVGAEYAFEQNNMIVYSSQGLGYVAFFGQFMFDKDDMLIGVGFYE